MAESPAVKVPSEEPARPDGARSQLLRRLVDEIHEEPFQPQYRRQTVRSELMCWPDRLRSYFWPDPESGYTKTYDKMNPWYVEVGELSEMLRAGRR